MLEAASCECYHITHSCTLTELPTRILICTLRHRNSILDSSLHSLSLIERETHFRASSHRPYAFMFLFPFCMLTIADRHGLDCHFDYAFNHGVSAGATTLSVDHRGCYLAVPLVPFRSPGCAEESSLVRALIGRRSYTRSLLEHLLLAATVDDTHSSRFCATSRKLARVPPVRGASRTAFPAHGTILHEDTGPARHEEYLRR
jgi:hypothetical protein